MNLVLVPLFLVMWILGLSIPLVSVCPVGLTRMRDAD